MRDFESLTQLQSMLQNEYECFSGDWKRSDWKGESLSDTLFSNKGQTFAIGQVPSERLIQGFFFSEDDCKASYDCVLVSACGPPKLNQDGSPSAERRVYCDTSDGTTVCAYQYGLQY